MIVEQPSAPTTTGSVSRYMDKEIGKLVYRIRGTVPSSNCVSSPRGSLRLATPHIHTILRPHPGKPLTVHYDFQCKDARPVRLSISSFFSKPKVAGTTLRLPLALFTREDPASTDHWVCASIHVDPLFSKFAPDLTSKGISHLKSVTHCAAMSLLGTYGTHDACTMEELCRRAEVKIQPEECRWIPRAPRSLTRASPRRKKQSSAKAAASASTSPTAMAVRIGGGDPDKGNLPEPPSKGPQTPLPPTPPVPPRPSRRVSAIPPTPPVPPRPSPSAKVSRIIGCGRITNLSWSKSDTALSFPCNNTVVTMMAPPPGGADAEDMEQEFLNVPSAVHLTGVSPSSEYLAAASVSHLRIYHAPTSRLLASIPVDADVNSPTVPPPVALTFSIDEACLALVYYDPQRRLSIVVYDLKPLSTPPNGSHLKILPLVAKQTSDFPITTLRFSPYDAQKLVSCGRENVRFWRIKSSHLPACPAVLNEFARGTTFTDLAFESSYGMLDDRDTPKIVFTSTTAGTVLQISYQERSVLCVLKLHDGPINTLAVNEGYAVTGSDDKYLRLWPLDFSDYLLEAKHESAVSKVALSLDGLRLLVGTAAGTVGVLDVVTQKYTTVMRSHESAVLLAIHDPNPESRSIATLGVDRTIRVWSLDTGKQKYEFLSPHDAPTSLAYHPSSSEIACGFESGFARIFDVGSVATRYELEQHTGPVRRLIYSPEGKILYSAATDGHISMFDVTQEYLPIKTIACDVPANNVKMCLSDDGSLLAASGPGQGCVTVYDAETIVPKKKLFRKAGGDAEAEIKDMYFYGPSSVVAFTESKALYFKDVLGGGTKVSWDALGAPGRSQFEASCFAKSSDGRFFAAAAKDPNLIYLFTADTTGGGRILQECKRCTGFWGGITSLSFSVDDSRLVASDDCGVVYVWDVEALKDVKRTATLETIEAAEVESDTVQEEDKEVGREDENNPNADNSIEADPRASIKALSLSPPLKKPSTPTRPNLTVDQTMSMVLDEMIRRGWITNEVANAMSGDEYPAQRSMLMAACDAFLVNEDFEELLDTFMITARHITTTQTFNDVDEDDEVDDGEDYAEDYAEVDEDNTEIDPTSYLEATSKETDTTCANADPAETVEQEVAAEREEDTSQSLFTLDKISGYDGKGLLWKPSSGLLVYSTKNVVVVEDLEEARQSFAVVEEGCQVMCFDLSGNDKFLATGGSSSKDNLQIWQRTEDGGLIDFLSVGIFDSFGVQSVCFCCDDEVLVAISCPCPEEPQKLIIWDFLRESCVARVFELGQAAGCVEAFDTDGVAIAGLDGLYLYNFKALREMNDGNASFLERAYEDAANDSMAAQDLMPDVTRANFEMVDGGCITAMYVEGNDIWMGTTLGSVEKYNCVEGVVDRSFDCAPYGGEIKCLAAKGSGILIASGGFVGVYGKDKGDLRMSWEGDRDVECMQWDGEGLEGVVGMKGCVKYLRMKDSGDTEVIDLMRGEGGERVALSADEKYLAVASGRTGVVVYELATMREVGSWGPESIVREGVIGEPSKLTCKELVFGEGRGESGEFLVAASWNNWAISVFQVGGGGGTDCVGWGRGKELIGHGMEWLGDIKLSFVDGDSFLAAGGSDGELMLVPVVVEGPGGPVRVEKSEWFDLLEHQKGTDGGWLDKDEVADWKWTSISSHPLDSSVWCCTKLVRGPSGRMSAHLFVFQQGVNRFTVSVMDTLGVAGARVVEDVEHVNAKFSVLQPGVVVVALGEEGGDGAVIGYRMGMGPGKEGTVEVMGVVGVEDMSLVQLNLSAGNLIALGGSSGDVFFMTELEMEPLETWNAGASTGRADFVLGSSGEMLVAVTCTDGGGVFKYKRIEI